MGKKLKNLKKLLKTTQGIDAGGTTLGQCLYNANKELEPVIIRKYSYYDTNKIKNLFRKLNIDPVLNSHFGYVIFDGLLWWDRTFGIERGTDLEAPDFIVRIAIDGGSYDNTVYTIEDSIYSLLDNDSTREFMRWAFVEEDISIDKKESQFSLYRVNTYTGQESREKIADLSLNDVLGLFTKGKPVMKLDVVFDFPWSKFSNPTFSGSDLLVLLDHKGIDIENLTIEDNPISMLSGEIEVNKNTVFFLGFTKNVEYEQGMTIQDLLKDFKLEFSWGDLVTYLNSQGYKLLDPEFNGYTISEEEFESLVIDAGEGEVETA